MEKYGMLKNQLSATPKISNRLSLAVYPLSIVYRPLSMVYRLLSLAVCLLSIVYCLSSTASLAFAQETATVDDQQRLATHRFPVGEVIEYKITQFKMTMGNAQLAFVGPVVKDEQQLFLIAFEADGPAFYDKEMIYVDPINYLPIIVERNVDYLGNKELIVEKYDQQAGRVEITKVSNGEEITQTIVKQGPIENIYGYIYRTRQQHNLMLGQQIAINLPTMDIVMEVLKQHDYKLSGERRDSYYLNSTPSKYQLWLGADDKVIPYKIKGSVGIANTAMEFVDYRVVGEKLKEEYK